MKVIDRHAQVLTALRTNQLLVLLNGNLPECILTAANVHTLAEFGAYFLAKYSVASYLPYNRSTIPYAPVQMGLGGAFFFLKAAYSLGL